MDFPYPCFRPEPKFKIEILEVFAKIKIEILEVLLKINFEKRN